MDILIVDYNHIDAYVTREALKDAFDGARIHIVHDAGTAITLLYSQGVYRTVPRQDLILLDLQLPSPSGLDFLSTLKISPVLKSIPVVVLTNPDVDSELYTTYTLGAHYYLQKPEEPAAYRMIGYVIAELWERGLLPAGKRPYWEVPDIGS